MSDAPETDAPAAAGGLPDGIESRLDRIDGALRDFNRRAAHREAVIDRLHEENQELRNGVRRAMLDPVVTDLVRLFDGLTRQAGQLAADDQEAVAKLFGSFADDVELVLDRCGVEVFGAQPGDTFQTGVHAASAMVTTDDPARHNTLVRVVTQGLRDGATGRVRRPVKAQFYRLASADAEPVPAPPIGADS